MEGALALIFVFLLIRAWLKYRHERKLREIEARNQAQAQAPQLMAANTDVDERLRNLESIVCDVDFELNAKLNKLASKQLQMASVVSRSAQAIETAETAALSVGKIGAGTRVAGRFVIERQLGAGGMGAVYLARDEQLDEVVALKAIAGGALLDPAAADRFRREVSAARRISHPNIVRLHDIGEEQGMLFLSMEYISGTSLAELIERHGVLPVGQLRAIVAQIGRGLEAAHSAGVVHRDLKPQNVLVDASQQVKIIDFGLARLAHLEGMTATGLILGTPEYMAPEQIRGQTIDTRTDIYALGAVMYHALTGKPPFGGDSPIAIGFAHCTKPLIPPEQVRPDVPPAWSAFVQRAMAKDPSQRFDSAAQLVEALPST